MYGNRSMPLVFGPVLSPLQYIISIDARHLSLSEQLRSIVVRLQVEPNDSDISHTDQSFNAFMRISNDAPCNPDTCNNRKTDNGNGNENETEKQGLDDKEVRSRKTRARGRILVNPLEYVLQLVAQVPVLRYTRRSTISGERIDGI